MGTENELTVPFLFSQNIEFPNHSLVLIFRGAGIAAASEGDITIIQFR
jgi:hypothetical protein